MTEKPGSIKPSDTSILIVDDNPQYTQLLKKILGLGFGYNDITSVDSPQKALQLIEESPERFKMLFVDYRFPEVVNGGDLLLKLKELDLMKEKVAFLITSEPTVDNQRQALRAGAQGVVAKPFARTSIQQQLDKVERSLQMDSKDQF